MGGGPLGWERDTAKDNPLRVRGGPAICSAPLRNVFAPRVGGEGGGLACEMLQDRPQVAEPISTELGIPSQTSTLEVTASDSY